MKKYGLIGKTLSYSFSKNYFAAKFSDLGINDSCVYENYELDSIQELHELISNDKTLCGLNVTIPFKEQVMPLLTKIDSAAAEIGAVNTVKIERSSNGKITNLTGFNTDCQGFLKSITPQLKPFHIGALIFGTGGASKAVIWALNKLEIPFIQVSRSSARSVISYNEINEELLTNYPIIINATPVGTFPDIGAAPAIPYQYISEINLLFDLVYNPSITKFMQEGFLRGAEVSNGLEMLKIQADEAWHIWNTP
jgi:shikimate dehydrogenase